MTQITINVEDSSILPHLEKILSAIRGVSISKTDREKTCGLDEAYEDIRLGRVTHYNSAEDLFKSMGI